MHGLPQNIRATTEGHPHWGCVGISVVFLGVAAGPGSARGGTGTSGPSARTSVTALGGLQLGTNELIGEDPSVIIRIDASQVMVRLDVASGTIHCTFGFYCSEHALGNSRL